MFHCSGSWNNYKYILQRDENAASITAMEAGITRVITATYPVMKMTRLIAMEAGISKVITATYPVMKITCVSLQWKLGELT